MQYSCSTMLSQFLLWIQSVVSSSFAAPRTIACQAHLSMGFSKQEYWSGLPCPPPEFLLHSKVNQLFVCIYPLSFGFPFHLGHHRALGRIPSAIQQVLASYLFYMCMCAKLLQSCLTLCDPMDCSPPGPNVHGVFQARILKWVAMPFSRGSSWSRDRTQISCTGGRFFTTSATWEAHLFYT